MNTERLRITLVGPLPPPSGGMANQTQQLARLLQAEGIDVRLVQVNAPYRPAWIGRVHGLRALFRLLPYLVRLWRTVPDTHLLHLLANSGWSWYLFAAPAVWIAKWRGIPVLVNYRGGEAESFLARSHCWVKPTLKRADLIIVPSGFLQSVFDRYRIASCIVPNIIDLTRFTPAPPAPARGPHLIVTRNLEPIYDIPTALQAFQVVHEVFPEARLTIAGSGPLRAELEQWVRQRQLDRAVTFTGRLDNERIAELYRDADLMLNPSRIDNTPISILEALACGVPVVSTRVGGVPFLVEDGRTALLVPAGDAPAMAQAVICVLTQPALAQTLRRGGLELVQWYSWSRVRKHLFDAYRQVLAASPHNLQLLRPDPNE